MTNDESDFSALPGGGGVRLLHASAAATKRHRYSCIGLMCEPNSCFRSCNKGYAMKFTRLLFAFSLLSGCAGTHVANRVELQRRPENSLEAYEARRKLREQEIRRIPTSIR